MRNGRAQDASADAALEKERRGCAVAESRAGQRLHPASRVANQPSAKHKQAGKLEEVQESGKGGG